MSTLKATNLQHPSAASPNVVMGSTGSVAVAGALTGAGLDLVATASFTTATSVSVNNCFTSAYANYRIVISAVGTPTVNNYTLFRLRASGVDSATLYNYYNIYVNNTGGPTRVHATDSTFINGGWIGTYGMATEMDIHSPYMATFTHVNGHENGWGNADSTTGTVHGIHTATTLYDGFSIINNSGTFTGVVRVYGYRNS